MNNDHDHNAREIINRLVTDQGLNGKSPGDCGEHGPYVSAILDEHERGGATAARLAVDRLKDSSPDLYQIICGDPEPKPVFEFFNFTELLKQPDRACIIAGILARRDIGMIYGAPGSGKSFVAIDLAVSAALGKPWAKHYSIPEPLKVAYMTGEGVSSIKARFAAAVNHRTVSPAVLTWFNKNLFISLDVPQMFADDVPQSISRFVKEWSGKNLDIAIIDTLHNSSVGAEENSAKDMGKVVESIKNARDELGCAVILVHHSNKQGAYRGSSALHASMDIMVEVVDHRDEGSRSVRFFKIKDKTRDSPPERSGLLFDLHSEYISQSAFVAWYGMKQGEIPAAKQHRKKQTKKDIVKKKVPELLADGKTLNQSEIVKCMDGTAGRKTVIAALQELEQSSEVIVSHGPNQAKCYQCPQTRTD